MQIKSKKILIYIYLLIFVLVNSNLNAEEFNISAKEIVVDKENETLVGKGSVEATDLEGNIIYSDNITYKKSKEYLSADGNVKIIDKKGNIIKADKATFDKLNGVINTYKNTQIEFNDSYNLKTHTILYDMNEKIISSSKNSTFTDIDGNIIETSKFQYDIKNNLFSSIGKIKISDVNENVYFFKEIFVDTKKKEMIGSDISIVLNQENFGVSKKSDPRFVGNEVFVSNNKTTLSKGVFTVCQKRNGKCPPWSIKAKKITHDKITKNIYYEHATLKIYDVPIFYFPKFFHPDPTVKRQSGFLAPFFTNTTAVGNGFALPYYWATNTDKDFTFTPKIYASENALFLNEYRQAFKNGFLILDAGYTEGYKKTTTKKTEGSRNHLFANLDLNLSQDESYESNFSLQMQRTSNNTYFRNHKINTTLVDSENTNLDNEIKYKFSKNNMYLDISANVYQNLRDKNNSDQYEYLLPNIMYGNTFFSNKLGIIDFKSNAFYNKYETNKSKTFLTNEVIWSPTSIITQKGIISSLQGMIRNTNYETNKTSLSSSDSEKYKDGNMENEISGVLAQKFSLPMKKTNLNHSNIFSPNFMIRYAPGHMRNISDKKISFNHSDLYALNKTPEIEKGLSAILGFDFKINEKTSNNSEKEKFSLMLGQVFNHEKNRDIPANTSLDQKMSDIIGNINYNFSEIGNIDYKFKVDHNLNDINYNKISTDLDFGKVAFNLDYLEETNHVGTEHYASSGISLNINDKNSFSFSTKKNFKTDSTELYNLAYQYEIDCLKAGLSYRREFYQDSDLEPNNTLMFTMTFVPFGAVSTPDFQQ